MSAVIYCRVSKDDERNGRSVGEQESECRDSADYEGWTVAAVFPENDRSASRFASKDRPQYRAMVEYLERHRPDVLILWESSRGSREPIEWFTLLAMCRTYRIRIHVVKDRRTYDLSVGRDWKNLAEDGVDSAYESEKIGERVRRAMNANADDGMPHGRTQYGFKREYEIIEDRRGGVRRKFVAQHINEDQAEVIREAAKRVSEGESLWAVCQDFNLRGIPAPSSARWDITKLKKIITNPAYIGKRIHIPKVDRKRGVTTGRLVDAVWPAILDESTWQTCMDKLSDPARKNHRDTAVKHLSSHIATCGVCEALMKAHTNNGYPVYMCKDNHCTSIPRQMLDDYLSAEIKQRLISVTLTSETEQNDEREATKAQLAELTEQLDQAREQYLRPPPGTKKLSIVMLAQIEADLEPQIQALEAQLRAGRVLPIVGKLVSNPEKWDDMSLAEKREFLRSGALLDGIDVMPAGRGQRKPAEERVVIHWVESRLSMNPHD
ncbi:recombinase family protein [Micromonospora sp. L5]|uniref:recombinase family protein n=1 Tax=Micromonospora sp. (strain L5) TaxID=648999 RepID=UPI0014390396|nr:recombinase family protein [Micromonospora sp. L5]